jgi:hypothetical protein
MIMKKVEVSFEDHYSLGEEWFSEIGERDVRLISCIGYLCHEDEKYYYIACTYDLLTKHFQAGTAVLKNCVVEFKYHEEASEVTIQAKSEVKKPIPSKPRSGVRRG